MIGAVFVAVVSGAKGRMECLNKCGVNGQTKKSAPQGALSNDEILLAILH